VASRFRTLLPRLAPWISVLVLLFGLLLTAVAAEYAASAARARDRLRFEIAVRQAQDSIETRLGTYIAMLRAGTGFFAAAPGAGADAFRRYVAQLDLGRTYPGIQGIGFSARVAPDERDRFIQAQRQAGRPTFQLWPAGRRAEYHAIVYLEPLDRRNRTAIGYDMFSEPVRRAAMEQARDTGRPAASGRVVLVQETDEDRQPGFLIYVPVYRTPALPTTPAERRAALAGFVYSPFRAGDLFEGIFRGEKHPLIDLEIYDGPNPDAARLLHRAGEARPAVARRFATARTIDVAGRTWRVDFATRPEFDRASSGSFVLVIVIAGVLSSALLFQATRSQVSARIAAERTAADLTRLGEQQRESEARKSAVLETALDAIVTIDSQGRIVEFNPAAEQMFGYRRADVMGREMVSLIIPASLQPAHRAGFARYLATGESHVLGRRLELAARHADGHEFPVELAVTRISSEGLPVFTGYIRDITETKRIEGERQELLDRERAARTEAEEANRAKDEFLALLSHELRTPLTSILGWARMIQSGSVEPERVPHALEVIERNARAQTQLINDLLDLSRIVTGRLLLDVRRTDLGAVVEAAVDAVRPAAAAKTMQLECVRRVDPAPMHGDSDRLQQVVWNLVSNAVKFTPANGRVDVTLDRTTAGFRVTVLDTGGGIKADILPFVFERFRQADSTSTRSHGGLGLGLAIARHLVELHGGTVTAASEGEGRGAVFTVDLPIGAAPAGTDAGSGEARAGQATPLRGVTILLAEDDADTREAFTAIFTKAGADVTAVASAAEALTAFDRTPAQVVVSDIAMPQTDGYTLIRELRQRAEAKGQDFLAVALTAYARADDRVRALEAGYQEHVAKPVDPARLTDVVARLVHEGRR
jgi:PAS domain S-box-containing protein